MIYHLLKLNTAGLTTAAGINGAPLLIDPTGFGLGAGTSINSWLKPSVNKLTISLAKPPPPGPSVLLPPPEMPAVRVRAQVYTVKPGSSTNEPDRTLAKFDRVANDTDPLPLEREVAFIVEVPPPTKLWNDAVQLDGISPADKQQLKALVQKHAEAIITRNVDGLSTLLDYKTTDCALADGQDPVAMRRVIQNQYRDAMFAEPSLKTDAQLDHLNFKLVAGGQVVWVFRSLAKPALVVTSPTKRFTLPIYAAMIGGAWRIVR